MSPISELPTTRVLVIDGSENQRAYWAEQLKRCSPDYQIIEADSGQAGLAIHSTQPIDCVILELNLPDLSGFEVLGRLNPNPQRPNVAVVGLTRLAHRGLHEIAKTIGAYACFHKPDTSGEVLDKAIQRAVALVGEMQHA